MTASKWETASEGVESPVLGEEFLPFDLTELDSQALFSLAATLQQGALKYGSRAWKAVPLYEHVNHAMAHLFRFVDGDETEDHLAHAFGRCMFALAKQIEERGDQL